VKDSADLKKQGPKWYLTTGCKYFWSTLKGILMCQILRPTRIFTFAKIMACLLVTDVLMTVAVFIFMTVRFVLGSFTWTILTFKGWLKELLVCMYIKNRIAFLGYDAFHGAHSGNAASGVKPKQLLPPEGCCCLAACALCCQLPGCPECPSCPRCPSCCCGCCSCCGCCKLCSCSVLCEFFNALSELSMEIVGAILSSIGLVGKAMAYTDRVVLSMTQVQDSSVVDDSPAYDADDSSVSQDVSTSTTPDRDAGRDDSRASSQASSRR